MNEVKGMNITMNKQDTLNKLRGKMVVSCQGFQEDNNPFYTAERQLMMAQSAINGGAKALRMDSPEHINLVKKYYPDIPMIGIWKKKCAESEVYITPTMEEIDALAATGCEVIALDGTAHLNRLGQSMYDVIKEAIKKYPDIVFMADCATYPEMKASYEAGVDIVATTLYGITKETCYLEDRANFNLLLEMRHNYPDSFILCEAKIRTPEDVVHAFECGANCVVVGAAITTPVLTAKRFVNFLNKHGYQQ